MMIKDEIKALEELESAYEKKESEVFDICDFVLKRIYKLQTEYNRKNRKMLFIISEGFTHFKVDEVEDRGDLIFINYYDTDYDCYDSDSILLPPDIFDSDSKLTEWFESKVSEYEAKVKERKQINENKEYQEYLRLKEKYDSQEE